jgi:hypothetical protein
MKHGVPQPAIDAARKAMNDAAHIKPGYDSIDWDEAMAAAIKAADAVRDNRIVGLSAPFSIVGLSASIDTSDTPTQPPEPT